MAEEKTPEVAEMNKSSAFQIRIADDFTAAWGRLEPMPDGKVPGLEELKNVLKEAGVKQGIIAENLEKIVAGKLYYTEFLVAEGRPAVDGEDGRFEFLVNTKAEAKPVELPDGTVDYTNMELFVPVTKGQLLVKYYPATTGNFGFLITGQLISPKRGKDIPPLKGKGFELSEDKKEYRASFDGCIDYRDGELTISRVFTVKGDLDMTVGHVHFSGDVEIKGDVSRGMMIEAGGSVVIGGHVGAASIVAGENVVLKGGMQGEGIGRIKAGGTVEGKFIESARVECEGDFKANYVLNCKLAALGKVMISGKKGAIIGGSVQGMQGISAAEIGNDAQIPTTVLAGPGEELNEQLTELKKQLCKIDEEINLLQKGKQQIEDAPPQVKEKNKLLYERAVQAITIKQTEREEALARERFLSELLLTTQKAKITVSGDVFPGVTARVAMKQLTFDSVMHNVSVIYLEERAVVIQNL